MKPFFSIIIPTLNEEKYLPHLLIDLNKQKVRNFEVIVVDAHSDDQTRIVAQSYSNTLDIRCFNVTKKHVSYQRNYGGKEARGEYLLFLDADSRITSSFTKIFEYQVKKNKGLLFIPCIVPDQSDQQYKFFFQIANSIIEISQMVGKPMSSGGSMAFEKNFFLLIGGFPEDVFISEDHEVVKKAYRWGVHARYLAQAKVKFSLRRMKREGQLQLFAKVIYSFIIWMTKGKIKNKIFEYQMGGHLYRKKPQKNKIEQQLEVYRKQMNSFLKKLLLE